VSGRVIDGYLSGATVCLDLNADQTCGTNEPKATTGAGGVYKLDTTGLDAATVAKGYILVTVPNTAKDEDDGGQTLAEAGKKPFSMIAPVPVDKANSMVTPLTTLVSQQMISGGQTVAQATQTVRTKLGFADDVKLDGDFKADTSKPALAIMAKVTAVTMGELQDAVKTGAPGATDREYLLASLKEVTNAVVSLNESLGVDANSPAPRPVTVAAVKTAVASTATDVHGNAVDSIAAAKVITEGVTTSLETLLGQGFGDINVTGGSCASTSGPVSAGATVPASAVVVPTPPTCIDDIQVHLNVGGKGAYQDRVYAPTVDSVGLVDVSTFTDLILTSAGWAPDTNRGTYTVQADGKVLVKSGGFGDVTGALGTLRVQDLAGKTFASLGVTAAKGTFPSGANAIWGSFYRNEATYHLYAKAEDYRDAGKKFTSLAAFLAGFKTPVPSSKSTALPSYWSWDGLNATFDEVSADAGTVTFWHFIPGGAFVPFSGKGNFAVKTVKGQQVLVITVIPKEAIEAGGGDYLSRQYQDGVRPFFAVDDRPTTQTPAVWIGATTPAGPDAYNDLPSFNKTALNAILVARGLHPLP
jgi:hypothetical protein